MRYLAGKVRGFQNAFRGGVQELDLCCVDLKVGARSAVLGHPDHWPALLRSVCLAARDPAGHKYMAAFVQELAAGSGEVAPGRHFETGQRFDWLAGAIWVDVVVGHDQSRDRRPFGGGVHLRFRHQVAVEDHYL